MIHQWATLLLSANCDSTTLSPVHSYMKSVFPVLEWILSMAPTRAKQTAEWSNEELRTYLFCALFLMSAAQMNGSDPVLRSRDIRCDHMTKTYKFRKTTKRRDKQDVENRGPCTALLTDYNGVRQSKRPVQPVRGF